MLWLWTMVWYMVYGMELGPLYISMGLLSYHHRHTDRRQTSTFCRFHFFSVCFLRRQYPGPCQRYLINCEGVDNGWQKKLNLKRKTSQWNLHLIVNIGVVCKLSRNEFRVKATDPKRSSSRWRGFSPNRLNLFVAKEESVFVLIDMRIRHRLCMQIDSKWWHIRGQWKLALSADWCVKIEPEIVSDSPERYIVI